MAWVSRVLPLVPGDQTVTVPVGAYTGSLRISVVAVSGMLTTVSEAFTPTFARPRAEDFRTAGGFARRHLRGRHHPDVRTPAPPPGWNWRWTAR
ncbi:MAG: hypothetical protein IPN71_16700 [Fibrobacteres bacterium]|nr:hypothetical protein [Fibrobacterota bacterium]